MRFNSEKKRSIVMYILEKINEKTPSLSARVAEAFDVSTNTVHSYLNELTEDNVIRKVKRGSTSWCPRSIPTHSSGAKGK